MGSRAAEASQLIRSSIDQIVAALGGAAADLGDGLDTDEFTDLLKIAFSGRNRFDAALTGAIGALDVAVEKAPDGRASMALSCAEWLSENLHISSSAGYAQVRLARELPSLPATASAFQRGDLSAQHASVVARSVEMVIKGGGNPIEAETLLLQEAQERSPRDLFRWGLSLVHQLAPEEMKAEEKRQEDRRGLPTAGRWRLRRLARGRPEHREKCRLGGVVTPGEGP
jgi:hypothetical protein